MISRKKFIQQASLFSTAFFIRPAAMSMPNISAIDNIGIQLYSLRDQIQRDVRSVIEKVAYAGYKEVETYGYSGESHFWGVKASEFNEILNNNGLKSPSGHYDFNQILSKTTSVDEMQAMLDQYIDTALKIGQKYLIIPSLERSIRSTPDDYKYLSEKMNRIGEELIKSKLQLGYHNHNFEFEGGSGQTGYQILLAETEEQNVKMELDLYWVVRSGVDPIQLIKENPGRFVLWHVKDMDHSNPALNTEIGKGSIDYKEIFRMARRSGLEYIFMEQENFMIDPYDSIAESFDYIKKSLIKEI